MESHIALHTLSSFFDGSEVISIEAFKKSFSSLQLKKNEYLVKEGDVCRYFCFLEEGILQHAITTEKEEKTTYLALPNTITTSLKSFLTQSPSQKSIKAIADTKLKILSFEAFQNLLETNPEFKQFYYNLIEKQICLIDDYRIDLLTLTPEERYQKLLANEPKLLQEIPLHYLASFLGISSRHMSRIRQNVK
ncbi:Crp/Fnr family transcriptional regulator [Flavobacterium enshiense]|uniref:Crp/Fnr family transcriptional regulator n=1 Tax=Flavobacterium enshiense TaxID=1341165 RepID=UPI00345DB340